MKGIHACHSDYSEDQNFLRKTGVRAVCRSSTGAGSVSRASSPFAINEVHGQYVTSCTHQNCRCLSLTVAPFEFECPNYLPQEQGLVQRNSLLSVPYRGLLGAWPSPWVNFSEEMCDHCPSAEGVIKKTKRNKTGKPPRTPVGAEVGAFCSLNESPFEKPRRAFPQRHLDKPFFVKGHEYGGTCSAPVSSVSFKGKF